MSFYEIIQKPPIELWNSFLGKSDDGNFRQSFEYGEIEKKAFPNLRIIRLALIKRGEPNEYVGIIQGEYKSYYGLGMTLKVMLGPLVDRKMVNASQSAEYLIKELENFCRKLKIICIQIWTPNKDGLSEVFNDLGYKVVNSYNGYLVNLENSIENLWTNIAHNKRRNIKQAMKKGVDIIQSHDYKDLKKFYAMLVAASERGGFPILPFSWYTACWENFPRELSKIFLARWRDNLVSGVFTINHGDIVYSMGAGSFVEGWKARPNDIMHWKVMEWASENGYNHYHMGFTSDPPPIQGSDEWGIWKWKREWKGNLEKIQVYEKIVLPRYKLILTANELGKNAYNNLKRLT